MSVTELTDATFDEQISGTEGVTVVDFWAPWCGPCRMVAPVIEELAAEYAGQVHFAKVNVDENQQVAGAFGIRSIPTIGFFKDGEPIGSVVGAYPKEALQQVIEQVRTGEADAA
ncbi:MAG: thioredoxin [Gemmatimonadota bacterium]|nr:thioredoxin [Gemmatimonadota bacterium]MDH5759003.1 thioredoxin [Gemmatimonadota bacterium]